MRIIRRVRSRFLDAVTLRSLRADQLRRQAKQRFMEMTAKPSRRVRARGIVGKCGGSNNFYGCRLADGRDIRLAI
jgi:hypothetical protein